MRTILVVLATLSMCSLLGQKPTKPIFNQKSYPKFKIMDSLKIGSKDSNYMNDLFNLQKNDKVLAQSNNSMPVFKPSYNSTMPIHKIDTTSIYFMRVYPNTKD